MRRVFFLSFVLSLLPGFVLPEAYALPENAIEERVEVFQDTAYSDFAAASTFTCGGLMNPTDTRMLATYARRPDLVCKPTEWCAGYNKETGACTGTKCTLFSEKGMPDRTLLEQCDENGECVAPTPHRSCNFVYFESSLRRYACDLLPFPGSPINEGKAEAQCYTSPVNTQSSAASYPLAYNCSVTYDISPVTVEGDDADVLKGVMALIPPPPFSAGESNLTIPSHAQDALLRDTSISALSLERVGLRGSGPATHPLAELPMHLQDTPPDLLRQIEELLQPPEVRLILPKGGLGVGREQGIIRQIYSSLTASETDDPVMMTLGSAPDALQSAAEYLRTIPLLEVRYVPVPILLPYASETAIHQHAEEWRTWFSRLQVLAEEKSVEIDAELMIQIENTIAAIQSYSALMASLQEYRRHFPAYVSELLSYVEASNRFFREEWLEVNAQRLDGWYAAYRIYLPEMRKQLHALESQAALYTKECLIPACRLDAIPVSGETKPWQLFSGSELLLSYDERAWLPEGPRLYENVEGQGMQWHPPLLIGSPLPNLTFDFSDIASKVIEVPVLDFEFSPLALPTPPIIDESNLAESIQKLPAEIAALPHLTPPLPSLTFPPLILPDPATSLLLVPEPPIALDIWKDALEWRAKRIQALRSICDTSAEPRTFLVHEFQLYGSREDPTARRATAFVPWGTPPPASPFPVAWFPWGGWSMWSRGSQPLPSLVAPPVCSNCGGVRPERYFHQHAELNVAWESLQEHFLRAVDVWNAEVRYFSVVPRDELESVSLPSLRP